MDSKLIAALLAVAFFFFNPTPKLVSILPNHGLNNTVVKVTINGAQFDTNATVKLARNGVAEITASDIKVLSKTKIACTFDLKGKPGGNWDLVVTNKDKFFKQDKLATMANGFLIDYSPPTVLSIDPHQARNNTTLVSVNLNGTNFRPGATVMLSNKQMDIGATKVKVSSETQLTCDFNLNGSDSGNYSVKVINDDGQAGSLADAFRVEGQPAPPVIPIVKPTIDSISPNQGFNNGMVLASIKGTHFETGLSVKLVGSGQNEINSLNLKVENATNLSCFFDLNGKPIGAYDVVVVNPNGQKATLKDGFSVGEYIPNALELNKALKPIYFDLDKAIARVNQIPVLDSDLKILKANPKLYILLGGHADERGSFEYNLDLSRRRSETIQKYLVEKRIDQTRITIYSYGKANPIKKGHEESSWWQNRRVDIMVWEAPPTKEQGLTKAGKE